MEYVKRKRKVTERGAKVHIERRKAIKEEKVDGGVANGQVKENTE